MSMSDRGDETRLTDEPLAAEIELLGDVIAVAAAHSGPLSPEQVDEVLGVPGPPLEGDQPPTARTGLA
jgi:hypothetical protein